SVCHRDHSIEIVIEDHGAGIPADSIPHLFERFFRSDRSRARTSGGFGLGLAIVQAIATKWHGTVAVQSILHQGSRFTVRLPAVSA
ncbi:MAG: sensor histidine kinase, partial [Segetibacter sp.]